MPFLEVHRSSGNRPERIDGQRVDARTEGDHVLPGVQHDATVKPFACDLRQRLHTFEIVHAERRARLDLDPDDSACPILRMKTTGVSLSACRSRVSMFRSIMVVA